MKIALAYLRAAEAVKEDKLLLNDGKSLNDENCQVVHMKSNKEESVRSNFSWTTKEG